MKALPSNLSTDLAFGQQDFAVRHFTLTWNFGLTTLPARFPDLLKRPTSIKAHGIDVMSTPHASLRFLDPQPLSASS